jgi:peptide chain release factor 3
LELLDEIESVLGMEPVPMNWPLGDGDRFKGVYDRKSKGVYLYQRTERNERMALEDFVTLDELLANGHASETRARQLRDEIALLDELGIMFDHQRVLDEEQTPVFFGSALTNFGVRLFLDSFVEFAPPPQPYTSDLGPIAPESPDFSGFVFKIQANMNPRHRDSVAFLRVCSGRFERGMSVTHAQSGNPIRLQRPYKLFANEREIIDTAFPGDVVGLPNNGSLAIGDTLCTGNPIKFASIPRFQPEHFALLKNTDLGKQKQFIKGLHQLESEGAVQVLYNINAFKREPILAVVGQLQFDVVRARLEVEYSVPTELEPLPYTLARWVEGPEAVIKNVPARGDVLLARDSKEKFIFLFNAPFHLRYIAEKFPELAFKEIDQALE